MCLWQQGSSSKIAMIVLPILPMLELIAYRSGNLQRSPAAIHSPLWSTSSAVFQLQLHYLPFGKWHQQIPQPDSRPLLFLRILVLFSCLVYIEIGTFHQAHFLHITDSWLLEVLNCLFIQNKRDWSLLEYEQ